MGASPDQSELLTSPEPDQDTKTDAIKHVRLLTSEKKDEKYTYKPKKNGKKTAKKEILGKERCIYKKSGDRKEYLKHKGCLITVSEYKKLMKSKK